MGKHKFKKRNTPKKKANPLPRRNSFSLSGNGAEALGIAAQFMEFIVFGLTQEEKDPQQTTTEDAEFTVEDPKQLPPCQ